ncbi:hypothetical protein [Nocardioides sp.]|uniref:hypothetical protein n=1 Tax=Nocardioides sp. TaxID=35761 RepID=UPI00378514A6
MLSEVAVKSGAGFQVHVKDAFAIVAGQGQPTIDYGLKLILRNRPASPEALWPGAQAYLERNGGRLVHSSHGFWRDWLMQPVEGGVVKARGIAYRWSGPIDAAITIRSLPSTSPGELLVCSQDEPHGHLL